MADVDMERHVFAPPFWTSASMVARHGGASNGLRREHRKARAHSGRAKGDRYRRCTSGLTVGLLNMLVRVQDGSGMCQTRLTKGWSETVQTV
ncbi:MAG: hypothetical protein HC871_11225 [Rhizobiales bacterium]|nr:hypothetical protein [Hyphomicrobiales bacterium]